MFWKKEKDDFELYKEQREKGISSNIPASMSEELNPMWKIGFVIALFAGMCLTILLLILVLTFIPDKVLGDFVYVKTSVKDFVTGNVKHEEQLLEDKELFSDIELAVFNNSYFEVKYLEEVIRQLYNKEGIVLLIEQMDENGSYKYYNYGDLLKDTYLELDEYGYKIRNSEDILSTVEDYFKLKDYTMREITEGMEESNINKINWFRKSYINGVKDNSIYHSQLLTEKTTENKIIGVVFTLIY